MQTTFASVLSFVAEITCNNARPIRLNYDEKKKKKKRFEKGRTRCHHEKSDFQSNAAAPGVKGKSVSHDPPQSIANAASLQTETSSHKQAHEKKKKKKTG